MLTPQLLYMLAIRKGLAMNLATVMAIKFCTYDIKMPP